VERISITLSKQDHSKPVNLNFWSAYLSWYAEFRLLKPTIHFDVNIGKGKVALLSKHYLHILWDIVVIEAKLHTF